MNVKNIVVLVSVFIIIMAISIFSFSYVFVDIDPETKKRKTKWKTVMLTSLLISVFVSILTGFLLFYLNSKTNTTEETTLNEPSYISSKGVKDPFLPVSIISPSMFSQNKKLTICTYNIFNANCYQFNDSAMFLDDKDIDLLCVQEDRKGLQSIGKYKKKKECGSGFEIVSVYSKDPKNIEYVECIDTKSNIYNIPTRNSIISKLRNGIICANVHLEGGRFSDQNLLSNYENLLTYKLSLLKKIIEKKPDIIVGDFNSVYSSDGNQLNSFIESQYKWFSQLNGGREMDETEKQKIREWNISPFKLLFSHGYEYAVPSNQLTEITNGRGNTIIDCIFYNPNRVSPVSTDILSIINHKIHNFNTGVCISDHNPVISTFTLHV